MWLANQGGLWRCLRDGPHILLPHDDGTQSRHLGIATVEDDHLRPVSSQALCDHLVPDGITCQIEGFLLRVGEDHTTHFTQPLGQHCHDLIVAVLPLGLLQADTGKFDLLAQQAHIFEATGTYGVGIFLMLHKQRQMFGELLLSDRVPVVQVIVGDDHRIHIENLRQGQG